jgi:hypothetical protein
MNEKVSVIKAVKTATFKLHNPSRRKRAMLDYALLHNHLAYSKALNAAQTLIEELVREELEKREKLIWRKNVMRLVFLLFVILMFSAYSANANEKSLNFRLGVIQSKIETNFRKFNYTKNKIPMELKNDKKYDFSRIMEDKKNIAFLFYDGQKLTHEKYNYTADQRTPLFLYSITKSFTGLLLIHSICEKGIADLDVKMGDLSNRLKGTDYANVTIRNALKMQSGVGRKFFKTLQVPMFMSFLKKEKNPLDWLGEVKQDSPQGQNFWYNANDTNSLGILLEDITRESIATKFGKLFIKDDNFNNDIYWQYSKDEESIGAYGLMASGQDVIRLGSRFMEILDTNKCVSNTYETMMSGDQSKGNYGFQIWVHHSQRDNSLKRFFGEGYGGQYLLMDRIDKSVGFIYSINKNYEHSRVVDEFYRQKYSK